MTVWENERISNAIPWYDTNVKREKKNFLICFKYFYTTISQTNYYGKPFDLLVFRLDTDRPQKKNNDMSYRLIYIYDILM